MKIGILGSGNVGQTLGEGFAKLGHEVRIGTREPAKLAEWQAKVGGSVGSNAETAAWAEVIVLATLGKGTESAIHLAGPENFRGKVVIDVTNPLDFSSGKPALYVGTTDSLGEQVQRWLPEARVVKAFNIVTAAVMINPGLSGGEPDMFIAGNDEAAKQTVGEMLEALGWGIADLGGIENARWLEAMCMMWVAYWQKTQRWQHAFKLVGK